MRVYGGALDTFRADVLLLYLALQLLLRRALREWAVCKWAKDQLRWLLLLLLLPLIFYDYLFWTHLNAICLLLLCGQGQGGGCMLCCVVLCMRVKIKISKPQYVNYNPIGKMKNIRNSRFSWLFLNGRYYVWIYMALWRLAGLTHFGLKVCAWERRRRVRGVVWELDGRIPQAIVVSIDT